MAQFPIVYVAGAGLNPTGANIRLPHFLSSHSKVEILGSAILPGGQMSSGMLACQTGGLRTRHAGKLGDDAAAKMQRDQLARSGVESHLLEARRSAGTPCELRGYNFKNILLKVELE